MLKDYYEILGVKPKATDEEIRNAYKKLAKAFHPDKHQGDAFFSEKFKSLQEAYGVLSDADKRRDYDTQLAAQLNAQTKAQQPASAQHSAAQSREGQASAQSSQTHSVVDLPMLVEMYFQKRTATIQARKFYDGFLATPKKHYISWLKFILVLVFLLLVILLLHPSWGYFGGMLP